MKDMRKLIVIGASAGGLSALKQIVAGLPADFPAAVLIVIHIGNHDSITADILSSHGALPVRRARDDEPITPATILMAAPDHHLLVEGERVRLSRGPKENFSRPAIDPLFRSAAMAYREHVIGVQLTGHLDDGVAGLQAIKAYGGMVVVQDPATADAPSMPRSALQYVEVDLCVPLERIADELIRLIDSTVEPEPHAVPDRIPLENEFVSRGQLEMKELEKIATPSTLTCPECHGTLWEIEGAVPIRFRCHVGHAFTAQALADSQYEGVEEAIWAAVRALNEKETLLRRFARMASDQQRTDAAAEHEKAADHAKRNARALIDVAVT